MGRLKALTIRNIKEITRDKTSLLFCLLLPVAMFVLMELLFGKNQQVEIFEVNSYAAGIASFGYTFVMLYIALTVSSDRSNAFIQRIYASPVRNYEYILSFIFASIPLCYLQVLIFDIIGLFFGLTFSLNLIVSFIISVFTALFYACCGILIGTIARSEKQAGPFCSLIITGAGLLGGVWLPVSFIGGTLETVCKILPFYNGVNLVKFVAQGNYIEAIIPFIIILGYSLIIFILATFVFSKRSKA